MTGRSAILVLMIVALAATEAPGKSNEIPADSLLVPGNAVSKLDSNGSNPDPAPVRPKVGLVLSGGGARGLAHVGVLKVIEEAGLHIDIVTGTSMGAIVGGLYAISLSAESLERMALETDWVRVFDDSPVRRDFTMERKQFDEVFTISLPVEGWSVQLPSGVVRGQRICKLLSLYTWPVQNLDDFRKFPRPFACVASDLETGEAVVLDSGSLSQAIRASMAIPSVFTPVRLEDRVLIDGFLTRNLPAIDARNLGADILIGVDVGSTLESAEDIHSVVDVLNQTMSFNASAENIAQREMVDILIEPDVRRISLLGFDRVEEIIRKGEEAARQYLPALKALADSLDALAPPPRMYYPISSDSLYLTELKVDGLVNTTHSMVLGAFGKAVPGWVSREELDSGIDRIYGSSYYEIVTYQLKPREGGTELQLRVIEKDYSLLSFGFNFNTDENVAVRFNLTRYNWFFPGSFYSLDMLLGDRSGIDMQYMLATGRRARFGLGVAASMHEHSFVYTGDDGLASPVNLTDWSSGIFLGTLYSTKLLAGAGFEVLSERYEIGNLSPSHHGIGMAVLMFGYDTLDRLYFGREGFRIDGYFGQSVLDPLNSGASLILREGLFDTNVPLARRWTFKLKVRLGNSEQRDFRPVSIYNMGGYADHFGEERNRLSGNTYQLLRLGLQWEPWPHRFFLLESDLGRVTDKWNWNLDGKDVEAGLGMTLGILTPFGPMSWTLYGGSSTVTATHVNIGYTF